MSASAIRRAVSAVGTALALLVAVPSLASATVDRPAAAQSSHPRTFTEKQNGKTVKVHKGHRFKISLETCTDCGDHWVVTHKPDKSVVKIESKKMKADPHSPGAVGFGYHTIWTLKAVGHGKTTIKMVERGPSGQTVKRYKLHIHIP